MSYATTTLDVSITNATATVRLNRPDVRNAFNETVIAELTQVFAAADQDAQVRCVVLAANGPAFCAGADLSWMRKMAGYSFEENQVDAMQLARMLHTIAVCSKPTIAAVQGDCYAGGMGLVAACDMAVAVETAQFCLSEVKLGLIPATISPYVIRAMGARAAQRYFLTAERFSAPQALQMGFVHEVCAVEQLNDKTAQLVQALLSASPQALAACKRLLADVTHAPITQELIADTATRIAHARASSDAKEGLTAFFEKRKPAWIQPS